MSVRKCPMFNKEYPVSVLNPDTCVIGGSCEGCQSFIDKTCLGCKCNVQSKTQLRIRQTYHNIKMFKDEFYKRAKERT
jgi:hypothetical protein